jgi:hypothetical protein
MKLEVTDSDERRIARVGTVLEYGVLLYTAAGSRASVATRFFTVQSPGIDDVVEWAKAQGTDFSIGAFIGTSPRDPEPMFVWLVGVDPNDATAAPADG